ncbi:MAG TPA: NAD(P)H-dependent oxidoreductase [Bacteroidales bacterium]|nr:NAD(P)H-dependent oxidoreductase [Bacteroidales bacterium]
MTKKILLIHAHPVDDAFADQLVEAYTSGAVSGGHTLRTLVLKKLDFDLNFSKGYRGNQELEPDLVTAQQYIAWADHLVFVFPNWWGTYPALLKGFIDRVFLPGFAFRYANGHRFPDKLLKGKTARLIMTMDNPGWYYFLVLGAPGYRSLRKAVLHFCGIKPVRTYTINSIRFASGSKKQRWLKKAEALGSKGI